MKSHYLASFFLAACLATATAPLALAGQCDTCHGSEVSKWAGSVHANTQSDLAIELSQSHPGEDPTSVIQGEDCIACHGPTAVMNCIACHAPTAVLTTGGDEATALDYFFTTTGGAFATNTVSTHADEWPGVGCTACHDPMTPASSPIGTPRAFSTRL